MNFETLRRLVLTFAALVLLFGAVLPTTIVSTNMADMSSSDTTISPKTPCPDCKAGKLKSGLLSCEQMACTVFAVIAGSDSFTGVLQRDFFPAEIARLTAVTFVPATPPI